jgi:hypothetical protein
MLQLGSSGMVPAYKLPSISDLKRVYIKDWLSYSRVPGLYERKLKEAVDNVFEAVAFRIAIDRVYLGAEPAGTAPLRLDTPVPRR